MGDMDSGRIDLKQYKGVYTSLRKEYVKTADGIKLFGKTFEVPLVIEPYGAIGEIDRFMAALDNTINAMIIEHYGLGTVEMDILPQIGEAELPPTEYSKGMSLCMPYDKVTLKVLADPMYMRLARIAPLERYMFLAYFNLEFNDE